MGQGLLVEFGSLLPGGVLMNLGAIPDQTTRELIDPVCQLAGPVSELVELGGVDLAGGRADLLVHRRQASGQLTDSIDDLAGAIGVGRHPAGQPIRTVTELFALFRQSVEATRELGDAVSERAPVGLQLPGSTTELRHTGGQGPRSGG